MKNVLVLGVTAALVSGNVFALHARPELLDTSIHLPKKDASYDHSLVKKGKGGYSKKKQTTLFPKKKKLNKNVQSKGRFYG